MHPAMFFQADATAFININALTFIRFDGDEQGPTACLTFEAGHSETLIGEAARNLHLYLTADKRSTQSTTSSAREQDDDADGAPRQSSARALPIAIENFPLRGRKKAWFYRKLDGSGVIFAFVNANGKCSVRPFDAEKNVALAKEVGYGFYQEHFANLIKGATLLRVDSQPNLDRDCKERLPEHLFTDLRKQIEEIE